MVDKERLLNWLERLRVESNQQKDYEQAMTFTIVLAAVKAGGI